MNCIVMIYKLLISSAALGTRRARAKRGVPHFCVFYFALCAHLLNFDCVQVRRRFGKMQTSLLFRSPCTNFVVWASEIYVPLKRYIENDKDFYDLLAVVCEFLKVLIINGLLIWKEFFGQTTK